MHIGILREWLVPYFGKSKVYKTLTELRTIVESNYYAQFPSGKGQVIDNKLIAFLIYVLCVTDSYKDVRSLFSSHGIIQIHNQDFLNDVFGEGYTSVKMIRITEFYKYLAWVLTIPDKPGKADIHNIKRIVFSKETQNVIVYYEVEQSEVNNPSGIEKATNLTREFHVRNSVIDKIEMGLTSVCQKATVLDGSFLINLKQLIQNSESGN